MKQKYKKLFAFITVLGIVIGSLNLEMYKAYADTRETIETIQEEDIQVLKNEKIAGALAPMISLASPSLTKLLHVFMLSIVVSNNYESGLPSTILSFIQNMLENTQDATNQMYQNVLAFAQSKLESAKASAIGFLVAYNNFVESTGKIATDVREQMSTYFTEQFLVKLETDLAKGVNIAMLTYYGITKFFDLDIFQQMWDSVPGIGTFPQLRGSKLLSKGGSAYRNITFNANDPKARTYQYARIGAGPDIAMQFVDKVQITRSNIQSYNYGWDGYQWTQQYYMKPALDGNLYMLVVTIAKSLSPNQKTDLNHDGVSFGLYQVNEFGKIIAEGIHNMYYRTGDDRLVTDVPAYGINLSQKINDVMTLNFGQLRSICADLWGADVFPSVPDVFNLGTQADSAGFEKNRITDYSKNEPGIYDNNWGYQGVPTLPLPGVDTNLKFPTLRPGQGGLGQYYPVPGTPGTWDSLFPPDTFPNGGTVTTPGDWVGTPGIDTDMPDVLVPGIDIPGDDVINPDIPDVDNPDIDVPDVDIPDIGNPGLDIPGWLNNFWDMLWDFLKKILVPEDSYWIDKFNEMKEKLEEKVPGIDVSKLEELAVGENAFKDIYANFFGQECLVVRASLINRVISWARPIIQGALSILLLIYNYNQLYKLIRGGHMTNASEHIENISYRK